MPNSPTGSRHCRSPISPAVRWNYSHSTDVLGRVVEVASGQTLFQFEKQRLFDPLGMSETAYYVADESKWPRIAQAFPVDRFRVAGMRDPALPRRWESGGAGLVSTAGDYARFLQMLLNGGELDGKRYLKPETVALMTSDQIGPETGIIHDPFYFPGPSSGFGLGFAVRTSPPPNTTWPLGEYRWDGAGGSFYFVDPQDDLLVVFMVQAPTQGGRIQLALKTMMFEALGKGLRTGLTIAGLRHGVSRDRLAIERRAQLGRPALGIEVDVVEAEALFISIRPFEIVHQAPQEISVHGHAL